ncbi:MAG: DUF1697 domain-containing protein [Mameliella sp.]|nr:DUF1697 domain-containing protein [Phaeodactylibacter sp.]
MEITTPNQYIALLRGINVSGQKKIKMADLRTHLGNIGLLNLQTYIQSGNIVFESPIADTGLLSGNIQAVIREQYGFEVPTIVLNALDFRDIASKNCYTEAAQEEPSRMLIAFLSDSPANEMANEFNALAFPNEHFTLEEKAIYLYFPNGLGRAKLHNHLIERKLKVSSTIRNWRTVSKLLEMTGQGLS